MTDNPMRGNVDMEFGRHPMGISWEYSGPGFAEALRRAASVFDDPGPQCRVLRPSDGSQCRHHGGGEHRHVDQRGQAIEVQE